MLGCTVRELRQRMTQAEFVEWKALFELRRRLADDEK